MRSIRPGEKLRMKLRPDKPWMLAQLDDFDKTAIRRLATDYESRSFKHVTIPIIELKSVTMTLFDTLLTVRHRRTTARQ